MKHQNDFGNNGVYCIGNGHMAAYLTRGDILQLFGPPYSTGAGFYTKSLNATYPQPSNTIPDTGVWQTEIHQSGNKVGISTDFAVYGNLPCILKKVEATNPIKIEIGCWDLKKGPVTINTDIYKSAAFSAYYRFHAGNDVYNQGMYPLPYAQNVQVLIFGDASATLEGETIRIICKPGISWIAFVGGPSYPECITNTEAVLAAGCPRLLEDTLAEWKSFFAAHRFESLVPSSASHHDRIVAAIKSTVLNLLSQQSADGGVLAGHRYHLGYVRDQFGVSRAMLKLGLLEQAKKILEFYYTLFIKNGFIKNAQGLGLDHTFHHGENDEVEITGYLMIQAFDYLNASGDEAFIEQIAPMLLWALSCQLDNLKDGMIPFNGDETYIAGRILPRTVLNDGSAEATMLFILGLEKYLGWLAGRPEENPEETKTLSKVLDDTKTQYAKNFIRNGKIIANNIKLDRIGKRFTIGVCQCCNTFFGDIQRMESGLYVCHSCYAAGAYKEVEITKEEFFVQSVLLNMNYLGFGLIDKSLLSHEVTGIIETYLKTGAMPSSKISGLTVGYDFGMLISGAVQFAPQHVDKLVDATLNLLDETGSWAEYYENGIPKNTKYRPWESGINIEAIVSAVNAIK